MSVAVSVAASVAASVAEIQSRIRLRAKPLESEPMEVARPLVIATIMKRLTTEQQI
jgi:hypothetical protein